MLIWRVNRLPQHDNRSEEKLLTGHREGTGNMLVWLRLLNRIKRSNCGTSHRGNRIGWPRRANRIGMSRLRGRSGCWLGRGREGRRNGDREVSSCVPDSHIFRTHAFYSQQLLLHDRTCQAPSRPWDFIGFHRYKFVIYKHTGNKLVTNI